MEVLAHFNLV